MFSLSAATTATMLPTRVARTAHARWASRSGEQMGEHRVVTSDGGRAAGRAPRCHIEAGEQPGERHALGRAAATDACLVPGRAWCGRGDARRTKIGVAPRSHVGEGLDS